MKLFYGEFSVYFQWTSSLKTEACACTLVLIKDIAVFMWNQFSYDGRTAERFMQFSPKILWRPRNTNTFFKIFSQFKYFGNILSMLHEEKFSFNISKMQKKNTFSDVNWNLKFDVSIQTTLIWNSKFFNNIKENLFLVD